MYKIIRVVYFSLLLLLASGVGYAKDTLKVLSFNVENLFDGIKNGREYSRFKPPDWTEAQYQKKIVAVGSALQKLDVSADIMALQEIENQKVLEDLQKYYLPQLPHIAVSAEKDSAVQVALLSKYKISKINTHDITASRSLRPILDVKLVLPNNQTLQVLVVHLKSRIFSKSKYTSDEIRAFQYELLAKVIDVNMPTIIAGDFNDYEPQIQLKKYSKTYRIYAPEVEITENQFNINGTYLYRSKWSQLDHIIYDQRAEKIFKNPRNTILAIAPFITDQGVPNKSSRDHVSVSDHLPLLFEADIIDN